MMDDQLPRGLIVPNPRDPVEENLRRKCAFFFMDPVQKFIARRQAPWKLILQFAKIFLVTSQLLIFGQFRYVVICCPFWISIATHSITFVFF